MQSRQKKHTISRHYYSDAKLFETSLDIYLPVREGTQTAEGNDTLPVVVLVVGSAWMGHQPWIYAMTSWWNSSGPKTIASLGMTCVFIRHRGSYVLLLPVFLTVFAAAAAILAWVIDGSGMTSMDAAQLNLSALVTYIAVMLWYVLQTTQRGSASFDTMLHDVAEAMAWVHSNRSVVVAADGNNNKSNNETDKPIVFAGYSSGGHVAATLLLTRGLE
jgi:acetyl esterase/lipase